MTRMVAENKAQAEALGRMEGNVLELIHRYAADFRNIILEYEAAHAGCFPAADDLIWIESEHSGRDIRTGS